jgi:hypothetical protein
MAGTAENGSVSGGPETKIDKYKILQTLYSNELLSFLFEGYYVCTILFEWQVRAEWLEHLRSKVSPVTLQLADLGMLCVFLSSVSIGKAVSRDSPNS